MVEVLHPVTRGGGLRNEPLTGQRQTCSIGLTRGAAILSQVKISLRPPVSCQPIFLIFRAGQSSLMTRPKLVIWRSCPPSGSILFLQTWGLSQTATHHDLGGP